MQRRRIWLKAAVYALSQNEQFISLRSLQGPYQPYQYAGTYSSITYAVSLDNVFISRNTGVTIN